MKNLIVFDIGGTDVKYGVMNTESKLIYSSKTATNADQGGLVLLEKIVNLSTKLISQFQVEGIAISSAGVIDPDTGLVVSASDAIPGYVGLNIKLFLEERLSLPVWAQNDVNCFAIAEKFCGNAISCDNFITLTIGTGIGGAIFCNNKLILGKDFSAGEVGRMIINNRKFEDVSSITGLVNAAKKVGLDVNNGLDVFKLFDNNNPIAQNVVDNFYQTMAVGICNLIYCFNPSKVLIGGGITNRSTFINEISAYVAKTIDNPDLITNLITETLNKNESGLFGAYYNFINYSK